MQKEPGRISLARLPTPIESYDRLVPGLRVKRDDLTGSTLSGNKVRKLEYLLADARSRRKKHVVTCGGIQSNHCRATALAAAQLGLRCTVLLRSPSARASYDAATGNLRLMQLSGAHIVWVTPDEYRNQRQELMAEIAGTDGKVIVEGGSDGLGSLGYVRAVDELLKQREAPTSIVVATGSGGTLAGLTLGARRRGLDIPVLGVAVCDDAPTFQAICARVAREARELLPDLPALEANDFVVVEGYAGRGYAVSSPQELDLLATVARRTGLLLDPVYTAKAFQFLVSRDPRLGAKPLFIHTGGLPGLLA